MSRDIGVDIVEFSEIKERLSEKFIKRILSIRELKKYNSFNSDKRKLEYVSGRFAAKEAYTKLYKKFLTPLNFIDVEVLTDEFGAPYIESSYMPQDEIKVSISHSKNYVIAVCIKE